MALATLLDRRWPPFALEIPLGDGAISLALFVGAGCTAFVPYRL